MCAAVIPPMRVLDLDLDFFLHGRATRIAMDDVADRLPEGIAPPWHPAHVHAFLQVQCGLALSRPVPGAVVTSHDGVFRLCRDLLRNGSLRAPFQLIHVDAHSDLGISTSCWRYIMGELLHHGPEGRSRPKEQGEGALSFASWLAFALAAGWVEAVQFVLHPEWRGDLPLTWVRTEDGAEAPHPAPHEEADYRVEMAALSQAQVECVSDTRCWIRRMPGVDLVVDVPFGLVPMDRFADSGGFDLVVLSHSPGYTPASADALIPVIKRYIDPLEFDNA